MKSNLWSWILGAVIGFTLCFLLFGIHIMPQTEWTWELGEPIEMSGVLASPILILLPEGEMYYVTTYLQGTDGGYILEGYHRFGVGGLCLKSLKMGGLFGQDSILTKKSYQKNS